MSPSPHIRTSRRLAARLAGLGAAALLVGYHGVLFGQRLADLSLLDPAVGLRWLGAAALVGWLLHLQGDGVKLLWGRQALFFWLAVALLHLPMLAPLGLAAGQSAGSWVSLLPAILGLGLAALGGLGRSPLERPASRPVGRPGRSTAPLRSRRLSHRLFGRPPPVDA